MIDEGELPLKRYIRDLATIDRKVLPICWRLYCGYQHNKIAFYGLQLHPLPYIIPFQISQDYKNNTSSVLS